MKPTRFQQVLHNNTCNGRKLSLAQQHGQLMLSECIKQIQQEGCYISQNYTGQLKKEEESSKA